MLKRLLPIQPVKKAKWRINSVVPCQRLDSPIPMSYIDLIMSGLIFNRKLSIKDSLDARIIVVAVLYYLAAVSGTFCIDDTSLPPGHRRELLLH